jgi:GTPase
LAQVLVYNQGIRQTAQIVQVGTESGALKAGQTCRVRYRFLNQPELVRVGSDVLFSVQRTKGLGKVPPPLLYRAVLLPSGNT